MSYKKPFHELSTTAQFHTFPKHYGEYKEVSPANADLMEMILEFRRRVSDNAEAKNCVNSNYGKYFKNIIDSVLKTELPSDEIEAQKLKKAKKQIIKYVHTLTRSIESYVNTIRLLFEGKLSDNLDSIIQADKNRTKAHNKLISDINVLNRSLLWWFGDFDPDALGDQFKKMYEMQEDSYISYGFDRLQIPKNGICPSSINLGDRKQITKWAIEIYSDICSIDYELKGFGK